MAASKKATGKTARKSAGKTARKTAASSKARARRSAAAVEEELPPAEPGTTSLVIVESPAKARTIGKYLGRAYRVKATVGHVRDLPEKKLGIDVEHGFEPEYVTIAGKEKTLADIKTAAKGAREIFLATDPDREGEAIALARRRAAEEPRQGARADAARALPRDHQGRRAARPGQRRRDRRAQGGRAAGAPRARSPGGLQGQPGALEDGEEGALRRSRADGGAPHARGAGARHPRLHAGGVLDDRGAAPEGRAAVQRPAASRGRRQARDRHREPPRRRSWRRCAASPPTSLVRTTEPARRRAATRSRRRWVVFPVTEVKRRERRKNPAAPFTTSTLQQEGGQAARLRLQAHHAAGAGPVRGHRAGQRRGRGRSHHLHANRLHPHRRQRRRRGPGAPARAVRPGVPGRRRRSCTATARQRTRRTRTRASAPPIRRAARSSSSATSRTTSSSSTSSSGNASWRRRWRRPCSTPPPWTTTSARYLFRSTGSVIKFQGFLVLYREAHEDGDARALEDEQAMLPGAGQGRDGARARGRRRRSTSPSRRRASPRPAW